MLPQLFFFALSVPPVASVAFPGRRPTFTTKHGDRIFALQPTPAPLIPQHLFARQSGGNTTITALLGPDNTCGYYNGLKSKNIRA